MNLSGGPVLGFFTQFKLKPDQLIIVYDDIDLPLGTIRLKRGGGSGGHNGVKSIISSVGADFNRLRIGVGKPDCGDEDRVLRHVLGRFSKEEEILFDRVVGAAVEVIRFYIDKGLDSAMERYNRKDSVIK